MSCGVGRRHGSDLVWLGRRPVATAPIRPLAWEPPYAAGAALEKEGKKKVNRVISLESQPAMQPVTKLQCLGQYCNRSCSSPDTVK